MRTRYSRSMTDEGCISLLASSPSLVNNSKPLVLKSSRPTDTQRSPLRDGRLSKTVRRPSGSEREQISPSGLLYKITRRRRGCRSEERRGGKGEQATSSQ